MRGYDAVIILLVPKRRFLINTISTIVHIITPLIALRTLSIMPPLLAVRCEDRGVVWEFNKRATRGGLCSWIRDKISKNIVSVRVHRCHDVQSSSHGPPIAEISNLTKLQASLELRNRIDIDSLVVIGVIPDLLIIGFFFEF